MNATAILAEPLVESEPTYSDEELVARAVRGEQAAFVELVERHHEHVIGLARRLLGRRDVDDAVQEIYVTLLSKLSTFKGASVFETWLTRVVINRCRLEQRRTARWWNWLKNSYATRSERVIEDYPAPDKSEIEQDEERRGLHLALSMLDHKDREVLALRYFDEMEITEIAELLKCKPNAIEVRLTRAGQIVQNIRIEE